VITALENRLRQGRKLLKLISSAGFRRGLRFGVAAAIEHRAVMQSIPMATLIDVGANVGQFSLLCRTERPTIWIHAFEPLSRPAEKYVRLFKDDARTVLHRCALGPEATATSMYVSGRDDSSSLLLITEEQTRFAPGTATIGTESIAVCRLDEILSEEDIIKPALLKLDVQGYELQALLGCGRLLDQIDFVYVEVSFVTLYLGQALADDVVQFLFSNGFSLAAVNNPVFDRGGRCMQADFLFRRVHGSTADVAPALQAVQVA
jgi:FkbM family methyltransferase